MKHRGTQAENKYMHTPCMWSAYRLWPCGWGSPWRWHLPVWQNFLLQQLWQLLWWCPSSCEWTLREWLISQGLLYTETPDDDNCSFKCFTFSFVTTHLYLSKICTQVKIKVSLKNRWLTIKKYALTLFSCVFNLLWVPVWCTRWWLLELWFLLKPHPPLPSPFSVRMSH